VNDIKTLDEIAVQDVLAEALKDVYRFFEDAHTSLGLTQDEYDYAVDAAESTYLIVTRRFAAQFGASVSITFNADTVDDVSVRTVPHEAD
jgi:hypothetical protein